jgi:hypothetical protein
VPQRLARAREHVEGRIAADAEVLDHVAAGIDTETDPEVRRASGDLVDTLRRIRQVHLDLADRVSGARTIFIQAQLQQVFARRIHLRLLNVEQELLQPVLALGREPATVVAEAFADRVLGLRIPRLLQLDSLVDVLLAPPRAEGNTDVDVEEPGEHEGSDLQSYPPAVVAAANRILQRAEKGPVALSRLLEDAGDDETTEMVMLSALWAFAPDAEHTALVAERAGGTLEHRLAWGDELILQYTREEEQPA